MTPFNTNLKRLRKEKGMTQDDLARQLHVTRQTVSGWETGRCQPDIDTLTALAQALEADIHELIYGVKPGAYPCWQKKYVIRCGIFAAITVLVLIFWLWCMPVLKRYFAMTYEPGYINLRFMLPQLGWFAAGALLPNGLALVHPVGVPERKARLCRIFGVLLGLPALLTGLEFLLEWVFPDYPMLFLRWTGFFSTGPVPALVLLVMPFFSGILIFLSVNRE